MLDITYEIAEYHRREIVKMLEWAEYAINRAIADEEASGSSVVALEQEKAAMGELWDAMNQMQPMEA